MDVWCLVQHNITYHDRHGVAVAVRSPDPFEGVHPQRIQRTTGGQSSKPDRPGSQQLAG